MKKLILFTLAALFFTTTIFAQLIQEGNRASSKGTYNSLSIELLKTEKKTIEKELVKTINKYKGKTKLDKKSGEIFSDNAIIKEMSNNDLDIYAKVVQNGADTDLTVWFDLGGAYLSSEQHPEQYAVAEKMIMDFATSFSRGMLEESLKEQEKVFKNLESELKKLKSDKDSYEKDIEKAKQVIEDRENAIKTNIEAQKTKDVELQSQAGILEELKNKLKKLK